MSFITIGIGVGIGAAGGGIMSAIKHEPIWKGMLIGAATGAAGGGIGAGLGALGGAAAGEAGAVVGEAGGQVAGQTTGQVAGQTTGQVAGQTTGQVAGQTTGQTAEQAALQASKSALQQQAFTDIAPGGINAGSASPVEPGLGGSLMKAATPQIMNMAGSVMNPTPTYDNSGQKKINEAKAQGQETAYQTYKGWAHGGSIRLENNSFIIPADVVSAIGNGSTKAGAKYLDHLFASIAAGPAPKAGSLAKQRSKERHKA